VASNGTDQLALGVTTENTTKTQLERTRAAATTKKDDAQQDDGLQADERSLQTDLAQEKARKNEKDVVLQEASHILGDEVDLIHGDTKLAARVLPHADGERTPVN
jgi:carboxyl-terminal processing protease